MRTSEIDHHSKIRRRGPKPLRVRAQFATTAWLDGDLLWREGRVVWRWNEKVLEIGPRELDAATRSLAALQRHESEARRHCANFASWHERRCQQLQMARTLAANRAPDLETLVSASRRRNPAAIERLVELLAVESSMAEALPFSPARALFEAWPLSQSPLQQLMREEKQTLETRALGALVVGAAQPFAPLPGEPLLRRATRYGARFGFPYAPKLCIALLQTAEPDVETNAHRVQMTLENAAPLGFNAAQLLELVRVKKSAAVVADLAQTASDLVAPLPCIRFSGATLKPAKLPAQRAVSQKWKELRDYAHSSLQMSLAQIAKRGESRDLEIAAEVIHHLIEAPLAALGTVGIDRRCLSHCKERDLASFAENAQEVVDVVAKLLHNLAASPNLSELLPLLREAMSTWAVCETATDLPPRQWVARWKNYVCGQYEANSAPFLRLAEKIGVEKTRRAFHLDCWRTLLRHGHRNPALLSFALEVAEWVEADCDTVLYRLRSRSRHWNDVSDARRACLPLMNALSAAKLEPKQRATWFIAVFDAIWRRQYGARIQLPALAPLFPILLRIGRADDDEYPLWVTIRVALALQHHTLKQSDGEHDEERAEGERNRLIEQRLEWVGQEMGRHWDKDEKSKPDWGNLSRLVGLATHWAGDDETRFRQMVCSGWRYTDWDTDFEWDNVQHGATLMKQIPALNAAIGDNFARCPLRCFVMLDRLGALKEFEALRTPLESWRVRQAPSNAAWVSLGLNARCERLAARFRCAKAELGESTEPPSALLKIAIWPQKMEEESEALRVRPSLSPSLEKRLENLQARLENRDALRAAMRSEMVEALWYLTLDAELRAAERAIDDCYRVRLESLGAPKNITLDANLLNAALFSLDIEVNRKWLREIVRAYCDPNPEKSDWRLSVGGNACWLQKQRERGLDVDGWLDAAPQRFALEVGQIELRLEQCPLHILQMGNYFDTCLSHGGCNAFSSVANAVELNKRVVFARDAKGRVVGRQLLALSDENKLLGFRVYTSVANEHIAAMQTTFAGYARDFAARCGVELGDTGEVERLFVADWYNDGCIEWQTLTPGPETQAKKPKQGGVMKKKKKGASPPLTGRDAWIARLRAGEIVSFREGGNSMTPRIKSRQKCTYTPVQSIADIAIGDAVFCRVGSSYFTHLVTAIKGEQVQISNNHGHVNGWTNIAHIYGKVVKIEN